MNLVFGTLSLCFIFFFQNGVRGLMLDMYDFENDVWLCHSFGGQCYNYTAFVSNKWFTCCYSKLSTKWFSCSQGDNKFQLRSN